MACGTKISHYLTIWPVCISISISILDNNYYNIIPMYMNFEKPKVSTGYMYTVFLLSVVSGVQDTVQEAILVQLKYKARSGQ